MIIFLGENLVDSLFGLCQGSSFNAIEWEPPMTNPIFVDYRDEIIQALLDVTKSYSTIAREISEIANRNVSRSAIAGIVDRHRSKLAESGVTLPDRLTYSKIHIRELRAEIRASRPPRLRRVRKKDPMSAPKIRKPAMRLDTVDQPLPETAVFFTDRESGQCPYPLWGLDKKIGHVCGGPQSVKRNSSYCDYHSLICEPIRE
jgi:hypothetical protein